MRLAALSAIALGALGGQAWGQTLAPADPLFAIAFQDTAPGSVDVVRIVPSDGLRLDLERRGLAAGGPDIGVVRSWPRAVSFSAEGLAFDVSPHAGFGVSPFGGLAEGGAMLTVSKSREQQAVERLRDLGVKDGQAFGDTGRWYLFAAASGRAVGFNMLRGERGWDRAGWSTDDTGGLVGDAQVGVGWRKGDVQSSFGVIYREVRGNHMAFGQLTRDDTVAAVTFSVKPGR